MSESELEREMGEHPELNGLRGLSQAEVRARLGAPDETHSGRKFFEWWDESLRDKVAATTLWIYRRLLRSGVVKIGFLDGGEVGEVFCEPLPEPPN